MSLEPLQSAQPQAVPLASQLADEANHRIANHLAMLAALMRLQAKGVDQAHIALSGKDVQAPGMFRVGPTKNRSRTQDLCETV